MANAMVHNDASTMANDDVDLIISDDGLEVEDEDSVEIGVPFDPTKIDIIVKTMTIGSLENRLENEELDLTPDFQRQANVWNLKRKARLIESILLRIPLPSFYFSEDEDGVYAVVDGLQRLCAVFHFMKPALLEKVTGARVPPLELTNLQYLKELNGKTFDQLDRKFQRRIAELEITGNVIRANTPPAVKFNVFARLNQGGMPLNAQEIRNAIFPGAWRNRIRAMAESPAFLNVTEYKIRTERQQDIELVLRFVAVWQLGPPFMRPGNQTLDEFLNSVVQEQLAHWTEQQWIAASQAFTRALFAAHSIFGKNAFRKSTASTRKSPINRGLFEAQLAVCSALSANDLGKLQHKKPVVMHKFGELLDNDSEFKQAISYATGSANSSNIRIAAIRKIFREITFD